MGSIIDHYPNKSHRAQSDYSRIPLRDESFGRRKGYFHNNKGVF